MPMSGGDVFEIVWGVMVGSGVVAILGHLVATSEMAKKRPQGSGLGWFGPGPESLRGRRAYAVKRIFTAVALLAAVAAVVIGGPS